MRHIKSRRGFSLVQTMVAIGLSSVVVVGIAAAVSSGIDGMSRTRSFYVAEDLTVQVSGLLGDPSYCSLHFSGKKIEGSLPAVVESHVIFKDVTTTGTLGNKVLIQEGQSYQNAIAINSVQLVAESRLGANRYLGAINLDVKGRSGESFVFKRTVPIHISTDNNGRILNCSRMSEPTQGTTFGIYSATCTDFAAKGWSSREACLRDGRWHKIFSNSRSGAVLFGSIVEMQELVEEGAQVRIAIENGEYGFKSSYELCSAVNGHETVPQVLACLVASRPGIPDWSKMNAAVPNAVIYYTTGKVVYQAPDTHFYAALNWYVRF